MHVELRYTLADLGNAAQFILESKWTFVPYFKKFPQDIPENYVMSQ